MYIYICVCLPGPSGQDIQGSCPSIKMSFYFTGIPHGRNRSLDVSTLLLYKNSKDFSDEPDFSIKHVNVNIKVLRCVLRCGEKHLFSIVGQMDGILMIKRMYKKYVNVTLHSGQWNSTNIIPTTLWIIGCITLLPIVALFLTR